MPIEWTLTIYPESIGAILSMPMHGWQMVDWLNTDTAPSQPPPPDPAGPSMVTWDVESLNVTCWWVDAPNGGLRDLSAGKYEASLTARQDGKDHPESERVKFTKGGPGQPVIIVATNIRVQ